MGKHDLKEQAHIDALLGAASKAAAAGRKEEALATLRQAEEAAPDNPRVLNALGNRLLAAGRPTEALKVLERAVAGDQQATALWLNLAAAARACADDSAELRAIDGALRTDPYATMALLLKGKLLERTGDGEGAASTYGALLASIPGGVTIPPALQAELDHAQNIVARQRIVVAQRVEAAVAEVAVRSTRFEHAIRLLEGTQKLYLPQPTGLYFPYLPAVPYFDRSQFAWFEELEAHTDVIREEFLAVAKRDVGIRPYVTIEPERPVNQWQELNHSLDWGAFFLWENGQRNEANIAACPRTAALIERLPLLDIPTHGPTAMFSILKPGAIIPPHTGTTNIRSVVHLPLVVPPDCGFRVGIESREWREGEAWAFDDTIEHEAWNRSALPRAILILDAWNPYLTADEQILLRLANVALRQEVAQR
ncbi:MAG: aspartyl/asparaginyl beta-hydroxylase domain-containing protein [Sphingomicrobium sp.]